MKLRYLIVLLTLTCTSQLIHSQDYQRSINWQADVKTFSTIDGKIIKQPSFTNAAHSELLYLLPLYKEKLPLTNTGSLNVQLLNPTYSAVTNIDANSISFIKEQPEVKAVVSINRKRPSASIEILPFRKSAGGQIEKLESFTLRVSLVPQPQKRSGNSYAANSVLANGAWYKVAVAADGFYKVDYNFIKNTCNIDPSSFNLNNLAIFGNGGGMVPDQNSIPRADDLLENPTIVVDNNSNNKMDDGDYLLFYGQMADAWRYDSIKGFYHEKNLYSDKNFYFLTTTQGTGKRVQLAPNEGSANKTIIDFDDHAYHESDEANMLSSGKRWLGDKMTSFSNTKSFSFNFPNLITSVPVKVVSQIGAKTSKPYGSVTTVTVNGQSVITHNDAGINPGDLYPPGSIIYKGIANYNAASDQINIAYTFNVSNDPTGTAACYIDYLEVFAKRSLSMSGTVMQFRNIASIGSGNVSEFQLNNASSDIRIWDISNPGNIMQMNTTLNGSQLRFTAATTALREFVAFNPSASFVTPEFISSVENQNLHAIGEPDMIIVTYDAFEAPSNELAAFHQSENNISVKVVKLSKIYNEFGGGKTDISAIRDFMRMLYDRAGNDTALMPRYLLLMGDGSFDPKNRVADNQEFVPCYESYESESETASFTSDDFYALLDPTEGGNIADNSQDMDLSVGRLPIASEQEAWDIVNKIKKYKHPSNSTSCVQINNNNSWRNNITFIADDQDNDVHLDASNYLADLTRTQHPEYNYDKIYLDAYKQVTTPSGDRYPEVNTAIINKINSGTLLLNWVGHGGETNWAHERIFNMTEIAQLANNEKLPLFITATCEFSRYDIPERTAGEYLITNANGGAIASITTVRLVYSNANAALNNESFEHMFDFYEGRYPTLGEITMLTKNNVNTDIYNTRKFTLLGDPALILNYPHYNINTTSVNNKPISLPHDTLKALAEVTIKGEVVDENGSKISSFNGTVYPIVYDKISTLKTLGNDGDSPIRSFDMYKNLLFKGKASVTNGNFSFTFIVPKDINYQFGNGRISYYADNGVTDAHGYTNNIVIGGSADSFAADGLGPKVKIYMNDESFVYGGLTNPSPILMVKLEDETGINTTGNGIGHDLTAVLDGNSQNMTVLNDYYESELDNYKKGSVKYAYTKLTEGKHNLKVKAWDIHNNSSEDYTEFIVASDAKLALTHVYNYPNPFTTHTQFMFEHNKPCEDLNVSVQIYTVSGRLVKNIQQQVHCNGFRTDDIEWDGRDDYGDAIGKGVYVYKLSVRDPEGNTAHKFEKLVLLR
ncbi:MAG: type IX secretion system sortase PorU [Chitinophagales bacterium]